MKNHKLKTLSGLPDTPYFAVIFTSQRTDEDKFYAETADNMLKLAAKQAGYLGMDSVRQKKTGITVSYWKDENSIQQWKQQMDHLQAQDSGRTRWYEEYTVRIAKVERNYSFVKGE